MSSGLGSLWSSLNRIYDQAPSIYEKGSLAVSLFMIKKWRMEVLRLGIKPGDLVLDAGSGRGAVSELLARGRIKTIMLDASHNMLSVADGDRVQAVFEKPPFKGKAFDYIVMSFSLHASANYDDVIKNLKAILKDGGTFFIISIGKPRSSVKRELIRVYLRVAVPVLALLATRSNFRLFDGIRLIYEESLTNDQIEAILERNLKTLGFKEMAFGAVYEYIGKNI
ncbi:MAG: methyltransferase domain-containing protein [Thermoprotei archaeon]